MTEKKSFTPVGGEWKVIFPTNDFTHWEEVPDEDLWEDGELNLEDVQSKVLRYLDAGKYILIRRKDE